MNHTELAFVNQQLASMLRCGIPLEGGLRQLCANMNRGPLRAELSLLEKDLASGEPLAKAVARRKLPEFYIRLLELGARGDDLPGVLTMLADYYENAGLVWTKLKGLMVYPVIVLVLSLAFSVWAAVLGRQLEDVLTRDNPVSFLGMFRMSTPVSSGKPRPGASSGSSAAAKASSPLPAKSSFFDSISSFFHSSSASLLVPPVLLAGVAFPLTMAVTVPILRRRLIWRLPAFREASLSRVAASMAILLKTGAAFPEALALVESMQQGTPAQADLARWKKRCAEGVGRFADMAADSEIFPPMFIWLVAGAGEDPASGFDRAARVYQARSAYQTNVLLYAALPVSLLFLGLIILSQIYPVGRVIFDLPRLLLG